MKKMSKKIISLLLAAMIVFGSVVAGISEADFSIPTAFAVETESGDCGKNMTWSFEPEHGRLTISGSGDMYDWDDYLDVPWRYLYLKIISVEVSSDVKSIGARAFFGCANLTSITFGEGSELIDIGEYAFYGCRTLVTMTLPSKLKTIGEYAFTGCNALTDLSIPASVTDIGAYAFSGCNSVLTLTFADGINLTKLENNVYYGLESLKSVVIPDSVVSIGSCAFDYCTSLESVTIPYGVTSIGGEAFENCSSLKDITIPSSVTTIGSWAFDDSGLESITIPDGVTSIGSYAFRSCGNLKNVSIADSVTSIGDEAFANCDALESVKLSENMTSISASLFYNCSALVTVTIPDTVTEIGNNAFHGCTSLETVNISENSALTSIGDNAFRDCNKLSKIYLPSKLSSIGSMVFSGCTALEEINVAESNKYFSSDNDTLFNKNKTELIAYIDNGNTSYTVPSTVTSIEAGAFYNCDSLENIVLPEGIETIGDSAFYDCNGISSIKIPSSVSTIGNSAFYNCSKLAEVTFASDSKLESIGSNAFYYCLIENIDLPENIKNIGGNALAHTPIYNNSENWQDGVFYIGTYLLNSNYYYYGESDNKYNNTGVYNVKDGTTLIAGEVFAHGNVTSVTLPDSLVYICDGAFRHCSSLTDIIIPDSVVCIGNNVFNHCYSLATVTFGENSKLEEIGDACFDYCNNLSGFVFPKSLKSVGSHAFDNCDSLISAVLPAGVERIGRWAFGDCENLEFVHIPVSATVIGSNIVRWSSNDEIYICATTEDCYAKQYATDTNTSFQICDGHGVESMLTSIEINTEPNKKVYYLYDHLDVTGLTIKANYSDGSSKIIESGYRCDPSYFNMVGPTVVTVSFGGKTCTFEVEVEPVGVESVEIRQTPHKVIYYVGEALDTSGLELRVTYTDGTIDTVTSGFTCTPSTFDTVGTTTVIVTYKEKTCTFDVTVSGVVLTKVEIQTLPDRMEYQVGEVLDTTGLTLTAYYSDDSIETITEGFTCEPTKLDAAGDQTIVVTYDGRDCTFDIKVLSVTLESIAINTMPEKTEYFIGEALDRKGLTLLGTYSDGSTKVISEGFSCSPATFSESGEQAITVTYGKKECSFNVNVSEIVLTNIEVETKPTKLEYFVGEFLNKTGMTLKATYSDGSTAIITENFTCVPMLLTDAGTQVITVHYGDLKCEFEVTVHETELLGITVKTNPDKTEYYVGDTLDITGLTLEATYSDGSTRILEGGFNCTPSLLETEGGEQKITVTYRDKTCIFNVNVSVAVVEKIEIETLPEKLEYNLGDSLDTTGLTLKATYSNGVTEIVDSGYTCSPMNLTEEGEKIVITVTFAEKTCTFEVTVNPATLKEVIISKLPDKTSYVVGETLDTTGMMLTLVYTDGSSKGATTGYTCNPTTLDTAGTQIVTVTYGGVEGTFEVEVIEETKPEEYTILFDANGGLFSDGTETKEFVYAEGETVPAIETPVRDGYEFSGWFDANGNEAFLPGGMPEYDVELFAKWNEITEITEYIVTYISGGEIFKQYSVKPGMAVPVPGVSPAIDGLTFEGWTPEIASVMPENDLVYTAVFHGHSYEYTVVSEPDCTNHGTAVYTCSCGDTYTEIIPALGHDWGEWFVVIEATAAENGLRKRLCLRCAAEETEDIPAPEANFYVLDIADQEYSGYPIYPAVEAYSYGNARLDECFGDSPEESGYTVSYVNNTDAGVATAIITGVGEYYGVIRKNFNIVRKDISALDYADIPDVTDNGGEVTPDPVITDDGRVLVKDVDYIVEYENNGGAGQARIIVTGIGNYTGTLVIVFNIIENNTSITIPVIGTQVYTGGEIRPVFNLFSNGVVLVEGTDYTVEYADNINVGYGRIIITGLGNYSGTIVIIFRIVGTEITMTDIPVLPDAVYDRDYAPDFGTYPIIFNGRELVEGVDYDVIVRRNFSRGYYEIIIIGLGNFTGTITIYVNITGYDIAQSGITIGRIPDMLYEGEPVTPDITVYGSDTVLVENVDYIVEYRNNNSAGVATVIVKGIGAYRGTLTKTFVIYADNAYTLLIHTNKYELKYEQGVALKAEVAPVSERNLTVVWSSSNPSVATVNQDGFVTSCGEGDVIITATLVDEYGRAVIDPYGDEVSDSIVIKCTMTIWQKIIRFFRNLFSSIFSFNTVAAEAFKVR